MRFAGKLALAATLAAALVGSVFGAPLAINEITYGNVADTLMFGNLLVTFNGGEADKFLGAIAAEKGPVSFTVRPQGGYAAIDNHGVPLTAVLTNGRTLTITSAVHADADKATFTIAAFGAAGTKPSKTSSVLATTVDTNTANTVLFTRPVKDNISKVTGLDPLVVAAIARVIQAQGGFLRMLSNNAQIFKADSLDPNTGAMATESRVAAAFQVCYDLTGPDMATTICFSKPLNIDDVTVTMRPTVHGLVTKWWGRARDSVGGIVFVFITTLILSVFASYILYFIDPAGYSLGKRLSALPDGYKYFLARGDDDVLDTGYYGDEEQSDVFRLDPATGLTVRVPRKKDGSIVSTDEPSSPPGETTDALSTSVVAVFLLALFF